MTKLFHTIVGVGVALGFAACGAQQLTPDDGAVHDSGSDALSDIDAIVNVTDANADVAIDVNADAKADAIVDAGLDATLDGSKDADAVVDAAKDAPPDAFCDAAWPTTKGHVTPTCIDPQQECKPLGPSPSCAPFVSPFQCENISKWQYAFCINAKWQCTGGTKPVWPDCKCSDPPPGYACTPTGLVKLDAGTDAAKP